MKTSRFSDTQIIAILKQAEAELLSRSSAASMASARPPSTSGVPNSGDGCLLMARLKELEDENRRLKKMYAEERLKAEIITEAMAKVVTPSARREMAKSRDSLRHIHPSGLPDLQGQ